MGFAKILCPIDFSSGSKQAQRVATRLAKESGAELVIVHAWYISPSTFSIEVPYPAYFIQAIADDAQRGLDAAVAEASAAGVPRTTGKLLRGLPWSQIVDELENHGYDLCVIGTHGRTGLARVVLGSVAEKVVRLAPCPVLAVRPDSDANPFQHVLVPTDFSDSAAHALDLAARLVEPTGSISLLHATEVLAAYMPELPISDLVGDLERQAVAVLDKEVARIKRATSVAIDARSRVGQAGALTLGALDDDRTIDLVVMGSHGRTGIKRALMGSVAEKVVRHARCPVLVARKRA